MSLFPFPARDSDIPPPVPPKTSAPLPHISACAVVPVKVPKHKKSAPSLSKAITFDSFVNLYTSRNNSPTKQLEKLDTSMSPLADSPTLRNTPTIMSPRDNCSSPDVPNSSPKLSSLASAKQRAKGVFTARRKGSSSDLETMTTVKEYCMDSPTIPGRPAVCQEHGCTATSWRQCAFGEVLISGISPPTPFTQSPIECIERPISPLALPPSPNTPWPGVSGSDYGTYSAPPQVPPKAPVLQRAPKFLDRTLEREKPLEARARERPLEPRAMERERPLEIRTMERERPLEPRAMERERPIETRAVERYMERPLSPPVAMMDRTRTHYTPLRPRADSAPPVRTFSSRRNEPFQRPGSADSLAPARRHRRKKSSISDSLPSGVRPSKAPIHFPYSQLESLQSEAKLRSEKFDVLSAKDVEGLSRELSGLETRCQYLRETHRSLRAGRRTLHTRMISYLRSARSAVFSRESLLKQEEALAELDAAIDDWEFKLEKAEERRAKVKEKLLEHVAAALCVANCAYSSTERGLSTPPATPERMRRGRESNKESITIYALLADVEQEINRSTGSNEYHD